MRTIFVVINASSLSPRCKASSRLFITLLRLSCVRNISCNALKHTSSVTFSYCAVMSQH